MFMNEYELKAIYEMKKEQYQKEAELENLFRGNSSKKLDLSKFFKRFKKQHEQNKTCCA